MRHRHSTGSAPALRRRAGVVGILVLLAALPTTLALNTTRADASRAPDPIALYGFDEGSGLVVGDSSGVGPALDLRIADGGAFSWGADGLTLSSAVVASDGPATKLIDGARASEELTVEAWVTPANVTQDGPARIVGIEGSASERNAMLGQGMYSSFPDDVFSMRFRTSTKVAGTTPFTPAGTASTSLTHVVMTRSAAGEQKIYVDGVVESISTLSGTTANWDPSFPLVLGNLLDGSRPWAGTLCLVAIFDRALSAAEVSGNFTSGCVRAPAPNRPPVLTPVGDQVSASGAAAKLALEASDPDGDTLGFSAQGLPAGLGVDPATGVISGTPNSVGTFTVTVTVDDGQASDTETFTWTVEASSSAPVAQDDDYSTPVDSVLVIDAAAGVLSNDSDPDLDPLQALLVNDVGSGTLRLNGDGSFEYTPGPGFEGTDTFTYRATDGTDVSNIATVTISVGSVLPPPQILGGIGFRKQIVGVGADETHAAAAADLDGDGDIDLAGTAYLNDSVFWYENDGNGAFTTHVLDGSLDGAYPLHVADVDDDGDVDVLAIGYVADTVAWYENDGAGNFTRRLVDTAADGGHSVVTGDIDGDGDNDLLVANQLAGTVNWYENDGTENFVRHTIDAAARGAKDAKLLDLDGDGDLDVVGAMCDAREVTWYENDGTETFTERLIDSSSGCAYFVTPTDLDGDGDLDVLAALRDLDSIVWYEHDGQGGFTRRSIDANAEGARTVMAADLDGDGDGDVLAASADDDTLAWYENLSDGRFTAHPIDLASDGAYGLFPADVDLDGSLDVVAAVRDADTIEVHYRIAELTTTIPRGGNRVLGSDLLAVSTDGPGPVSYRVTNAPERGVLRLGETALSDGDQFTQSDVDAGQVAYAHGGGDSLPDEFSFVAMTGDSDKGSHGRIRFNVIDPADKLAHLSFDEGSGVFAADSSGAGNHGTLLNGATFEASTADGSPYALRLDGTDDYVDLGRFDVAGSGITLSSRFNADRYRGSTRDPRMVSKASGSAANDHVFMLGTTKVGTETYLRGRLRVGGITTTLIATHGPLGVGRWHHAAMTYDGTVVRLYLDGLEVGSTLLTGAIDLAPDLPVSVGGQPVGPSSRFFDGLLDEAQVLQRALSPSEVAALAGVA